MIITCILTLHSLFLSLCVNECLNKDQTIIHTSSFLCQFKFILLFSLFFCTFWKSACFCILAVFNLFSVFNYFSASTFSEPFWLTAINFSLWPLLWLQDFVMTCLFRFFCVLSHSVWVLLAPCHLVGVFLSLLTFCELEVCCHDICFVHWIYFFIELPVPACFWVVKPKPFALLDFNWLFYF